MTEGGIIQLVKEIIGPLMTMLTVVLVAVVQRRYGKKRDAKVEDVARPIRAAIEEVHGVVTDTHRETLKALEKVSAPYADETPGGIPRTRNGMPDKGRNTP